MNLQEIVYMFPDVEFKFGEYPYAACYSREAFEAGKWIGRWFCTDKYEFVIYIPNDYSDEKKLWSMLHELGHYHSECEKEIFHEEATAWAWAEQFMIDNGIEITEDYYLYRQECLQTYYEGET